MSKIHITKGSGKMDGIFSINTTTTNNKFCQQMAKTSEICKGCYAQRYEKLRPGLVKALERNEEIFVDKDFQVENIPFKIIRFHSFGELINRTHLNNIIKLVLSNPDTHFTLWTKRVNIIHAYLNDGGIIPSNLKLIYSNPSLNNERKTPPKGFHSVFNVFESKFIKENEIDINCGGKSCKDCMLCYTFNNVKVINEKKK